MSYTIENFYKQNQVEAESIDYIASKRFVDDNGKPIPWRIRPVTAEEEARLRVQYSKENKDKRTGVVTQTFDDTGYTLALTATGVVEPDLLNTKLQESYRVRGREALLQKMLYAGELQSLALKVIEVSGLDDIENQKTEFELDTEVIKNN